MATYSMSAFDIPEAVQYFKNNRSQEKARLTRNIANTEKWKKRLEILQDGTPEKVLKDRLDKLKQIALENGITFVKPKAPMYLSSTFSRWCNTIYEKDKVKITNLYSELKTHPDGSACIDVYKIPAEKTPGQYYYYSPRAKDKVIRFFVSENVRITNNVLRTLITTI